MISHPASRDMTVILSTRRTGFNSVRGEREKEKSLYLSLSPLITAADKHRRLGIEQNWRCISRFKEIKERREKKIKLNEIQNTNFGGSGASVSFYFSKTEKNFLSLSRLARLYSFLGRKTRYSLFQVLINCEFRFLNYNCELGCSLTSSPKNRESNKNKRTNWFPNTDRRWCSNKGEDWREGEKTEMGVKVSLFDISVLSLRGDGS